MDKPSWWPSSPVCSRECPYDAECLEIEFCRADRVVVANALLDEIERVNCLCSRGSRIGLWVSQDDFERIRKEVNGE